MVLKWGAVLCCATAMLVLAWAPVAFIANGGVNDARRQLTSILEPGDRRASVLPAFRLHSNAFLDPRQVPILEPGPVALAGLAPHAEDVRGGLAGLFRDAGPPPLTSALSERPYARLVQLAADRHGVDARLVHALIEVESSYRTDAVSTAGAMGLMQLMPATARRYGVADPLDPEANIEAGTRHLRGLLDEFGPLFALDALAAYHAGESTVREHGGIPPYPETRRFVRRVLQVLLSQTGWGGGA